MSPAVTLRPATAGDRLALWRWRNDPAVRRASFDTREIPLDEHARWLEQTLGRADRRLWIVGASDREIGSVRLDVVGRAATVNIALAPEARGRGLGAAALGVLAAEAFGPLGLATLRARVKPANRASVAAFRRAGYAVRARTRAAVELILAAPGRRLALIPARAGSRRFPGKNVALFDHRPLVARAVDVASEAGLFARIVVSTEDAAIARVAKEAGAEVLARDPRLAGDSARLVDVCLAALDELEAQGDQLAAFCLLLPTSPFRTAGHVREAWERLERSGADGVMSVAEFPHVPLWAVREVRGRLQPFFGRRWLRSRDRLPALYRHNGVVLWMRTGPFRRDREFYGRRIAPYYMDLESSIDIDHPIDLEFAEFLRARRAP